MFTKPVRILLTLTTFVALSLSSAMMNADLIAYDPVLGTLPESQGFTRIETGPALPPTVGGGILHQFPVFGDNVQFWQIGSIPLDFATTPYVLEANLKVISSNYIPNISTGQRSGYYLWAIDAAGRSFAIGIASTGITINTDAPFDPNNGVPFVPFDTTDAFHTYRLVIDNGLGTLFIDGGLFASTALGGTVRSDVPNRVLFGDASGVGISETELRFFRLTTASPTVVIGGCDSKVPDSVLPDGHTISQKVQQCATSAQNHGQFVSCVAHLTNELKRAGIITGQQKGAIHSCAAQADIP